MEVEPALISVGKKAHVMFQDRRLAEHINHQGRMQFDKKSASRGPTTISEYAKQIARDDPKTWPGYLHAYNQELTNPEGFLLSRARNEEHTRELLIHVLMNFGLYPS
ncbi:hypothetical protein ACHAPD_008975 [Fusarium lateritium]